MTTQMANADLLWQDFVMAPVTYVEIERLVDCFEGRLNESVCAALLANERVRGRLSECIRSYYQLPTVPKDSCDSRDLPIVLATRKQLSDIVLGAGAIYWGSVIANAILAPDVAAIEGQIGNALSSLAIVHRHLSGPEQPLKPYDTLSDRVYQDGWHCFVVWCNSLPPGIASRMRLKFASDDVFVNMAGTPYEARGVDIVRAAAFQETGHAGEQ